MQKKWVYSGLLLLMLCGLTIIPATRFVTGGQNPAAPLQINLFSTHEQNDNHISDNRDSQPPTPTTTSQKITAAPPEIQAILDQ
ncbi:MAG: hypothetical protein ACFFCO_10190, partial [Promethearchaeota archaeon]